MPTVNVYLDDDTYSFLLNKAKEFEAFDEGGNKVSRAVKNIIDKEVKKSLKKK